MSPAACSLARFALPFNPSFNFPSINPSIHPPTNPPYPSVCPCTPSVHTSFHPSSCLSADLLLCLESGSWILLVEAKLATTPTNPFCCYQSSECGGCVCTTHLVYCRQAPLGRRSPAAAGTDFSPSFFLLNATSHSALLTDFRPAYAERSWRACWHPSTGGNASSRKASSAGKLHYKLECIHWSSKTVLAGQYGKPLLCTGRPTNTTHSLGNSAPVSCH